MSEIFTYLFLLRVEPMFDSQQIEDVSRLLRIQPTSVISKGQRMRGLTGRSGMVHPSWAWRFASPTYSFSSRASFSRRLHRFLSRLPDSRVVWSRMRRSFDCSLYVPVEREYFLIEVNLEPDVWPELAKRHFRLDFSTLHRQGHAQPQG